MNVKKMGMEHGDKAALAVVLVICLVSLHSSIGEVREPQGPPEDLQVAARTIEEGLGSSEAGPETVPDYGKVVASAKSSYGIGDGTVGVPVAHMFYPTPAKVEVVINVVGETQKVVPHQAVWVSPTDLKIKAQLGKAILEWSISDEIEAAVPVEFKVVRQQKGIREWKEIGSIEGSGDLLVKSYSFVDNKIESKVTYSYKVQGVGTAAKFEDTAEIKNVVIGPREPQLDIGERVVDAERDIKAPLWYSMYSDHAKVTAPSDVKLFLKGIVAVGEKKANMLVAKYDNDAGWQHFNAEKVGVGEKIVGSKWVRKVVEGATRSVKVPADSDCKLIEIFEGTEKRSYWSTETVLDENGRPVTKRVKKFKEVPVKKLKVQDLTLKKEFWAQSIKDDEPPMEGSGAEAVTVSGDTDRTQTAAEKRQKYTEALIQRGRQRQADIARRAGASVAEVDRRRAERRARQEAEQREAERLREQRLSRPSQDDRPSGEEDAPEGAPENDRL